MMQMHVREVNLNQQQPCQRPNHLRRCESTISMIATLKIMIEGNRPLLLTIFGFLNCCLLFV